MPAVFGYDCYIWNKGGKNRRGDKVDDRRGLARGAPCPSKAKLCDSESRHAAKGMKLQEAHHSLLRSSSTIHSRERNDAPA
jgi:hypothetical protein